MKSILAALTLVALTTFANAQQITPGAGPLTPLFANGASSGNGSDTTEDILTTCSYTMPANMLVNIGDRLRIYAAGNAVGSTDVKNIRLRLQAGAGGIVSANNISAASSTKWALYVEVLKTGASTQTIGNFGGVNQSSNPNMGSTTATINDTIPMPIYITGQDSTNATANVLTCGYMTIDYISAPTS